MRMKFVQSTLASASSLLALSIALPASAQAQAADAGNPENLEEIVVTGLIGSLQRNLDMKREASGVVDVITAEDIGKFPDSNVAASLQRVPGVSIQRSGTRGEPTGTLDRNSRQPVGGLQHGGSGFRRSADRHEDARCDAVE